MLQTYTAFDVLSTKPTIYVTPAVYRSYQESIAANRPETFALIGGSLDNPFRVTDFFFLPPKQDDRGGFVASGAFVYPDHEQVNYIIDNVLVRNGRYMLGFWHSHPGSYNRPSEGDLEFCSRIIANDDSIGRRWNNFLAPITTFADGGRTDHVTAWVLPKGHSEFLPADFVVEGVEADEPAPCRKQGVRAMASKLAHDLKRHHRHLNEVQKHRVACNIAAASAIVAAGTDAWRRGVDKER